MHSKTFFFLTIKDKDDVHKIIFRSSRESSVRYPRKEVHWYSSNKRLHPKDLIYGWCCIGTSKQILELINEIKLKQVISVQNELVKMVDDITYEEIIEVPGEYSLPHTPSIVQRFKTMHSMISESLWLQEIGANCPVVMEESFCNHISGFKKSGHDYSVVEPSGYWEDGELLGYFKKHVVNIEESLSPCLTFRGTGPKASKEIHGFKGICKNFPEEYESIDVSFHNLENSEVLHSVHVPLKKGWGEWETEFAGAPGKGIIQASHGESIIGANKFFLLLDINIDIKTVGSGELFQDLYGRKINSQKVVPEGDPPKSLNWNSDYRLKESRFSDDLVKILSHMGSSILIQDPYFVGKLEKNGTITNGSKSFLNALMTTVINSDLAHIAILLDKKKSGNQEERKFLEETIKKNLGPLKDYGLKSLSLHYAINSFHDRYYLSLESPGLLYHVSKSVNGYLESDDLNLFLNEGEQKKQLVAQIRYRLKNSEAVSLLE